jgi:hypothetical protein
MWSATMAKSSDSIRDELAKYAKRLAQDLNSNKPRVYAAVVWAYQDNRVRDAIAARLAAGEILTASSQIVPDRALRRERVYFDFSPSGRLDTKNPGILVQINDDNTVAEILDPFDPQGDANLTVATAADTLPLFAAQQSRAVQADQGAERELGARWTRFVDQPALARTFASRAGGMFGGGFGAGFGVEATDSLCGGVPTRSAVMSEAGRKEDPDEDTRGGYFDDCPL